MFSKAESGGRLDEMLALDAAAVARYLAEFLRQETGRAGLARLVLGLSGGVDSALTAALAVAALGPKNVFAIYMPSKESAATSKTDAQAVADSLGLRMETREIGPQVEAYFKSRPQASRLRRGNKMARERMAVLYDASQEYRALVAGTSNKTELLLGYGTLFGDMASAINPLGDLFKTQVWELAKEVNLPQSVVAKPPSADLWLGQSDEKELGFEYREVDRLLVAMVDGRMDDESLKDFGFNSAFIQQIRRRVAQSQFKRLMPVIAKLGNRTLGREFRYPRDWGTMGH